ncbi:hypothetical protein Tco_0893875 [Tanacetum coccineum]|uniref:DUF4219 domain-containing protein n=1 Tax=Tanacetum coccineum TaxID=301880 RepID=A0ABQ5CDA4_9ASTR
MESEKYLEGQSMQRPPLFESDGFIYWKNRFETYVKSKDLDLWHVITDGDFPPIQFNPETKKDEIVSFHKQNDDLKKKLAKNNEAKMVIYNALPRKEYERIFMCQTAKEIWDTLLITHQGNNQVKANKIDLLVQQYEQFMIPEEESIDNAFAKFNTIITSLKALDEAWSDSDDDEEEKSKDEKCLMAKDSNEGPYSTDLPTPDDIRRLLEWKNRDMQWEELIRENVFGLGGHRDHLPACLAHMLYCVVAEEQYNLAYFFVKRIECTRANPTANLPYAFVIFLLLDFMTLIFEEDIDSEVRKLCKLKLFLILQILEC